MDMSDSYDSDICSRMYDCRMKKRTSLNLDVDLVAEARDVLGTNGTTETVHRALEDVIRREHLRRLTERTFEDLTPEALDELRQWRTADRLD
jgi:Arc/MetJ family transcription regulator